MSRGFLWGFARPLIYWWCQWAHEKDSVIIALHFVLNIFAAPFFYFLQCSVRNEFQCDIVNQITPQSKSIDLYNHSHALCLLTSLCHSQSLMALKWFDTFIVLWNLSWKLTIVLNVCFCCRKCTWHFQPDHRAPPYSLQLGMWVYPTALWARPQEIPQLPRVHPVPSGTHTHPQPNQYCRTLFLTHWMLLWLYFYTQVLWCHILFRSSSWSMHARHLPRRTKGRMASSLPWTSVTLWPPSDTTCSHPLWRRTLSQWVFVSVSDLLTGFCTMSHYGCSEYPSLIGRSVFSGLQYLPCFWVANLCF